jgi:sporadic carbohydrate cluster 2OG-Fe(II) oxygenase
MFLDQDEVNLNNELIQNGYIIRPVDNIEALNKIKDFFIKNIRSYFKKNKDESDKNLLDNVHDYISPIELNEFRLNIINEMNSYAELRKLYYLVCKNILNAVVGNELAMQSRINLSIQLPGDSSSLLQVHSDTWSGDSPYEVVVWLPLVDCYETKSMYILPQNHLNNINHFFGNWREKDSEDLFKSIEDKIKYLEVNFGNVLIFNQSLPHGNRINQEPETRWTMNCRFKSLFSPYGDKKIGEFFTPITLRSASRIGMTYKYPDLS